MSYIAFDLDALNRAPAVARASGIAEELVISGLVRMWAWCFREETDTVNALQVRGHFGADCADALVAFSFLEADAGTYRVRGAERYLRIKKAQRAGAKKTNQQRAVSVRSTDATPDGTPDDQAHGGATPLHRAPSTEHRIKKMGPGGPHHETIEAFVGLFQSIRGVAYVFSKKADAPAMKAMLAHSPPHEILRRAEIGLRNTRFPKVDTLAQLSSQWNSLAKSADAAAFDPNGGILTRPGQAFVPKPCTVQGCTAESWDGVTCIEHAPEMLERT